MKDFIKIIPITTLILIYLFICGSLYLIGFWSTFEIDIFSIISIYDIPKSFVFPLLVSQGAYLLNYLTSGVLDLNDERENKNFFITMNEGLPLWKKLPLVAITSIRMWLIYIVGGMTLLIKRPYTNSAYWAISSFAIVYFLLHQFVNIEWLKREIPSSKMRAYLGHLIIFLPISCFSIAKIKSLEIYNNKCDIHFVTNLPKPSCDSISKLKLLGFAGDIIVVSTEDNKNVFFFNKDNSTPFLLQH